MYAIPPTYSPSRPRSIRTYHMTNPLDFYNKEDVWAWPQEIFYNEPQPMEPYYVLMQLPGSNELDYMQILPFTPANRENMIAWMAAKSNLAKYGQLIVYEFGKDSLFFGPKQVEARIDQDPVISAQLSLWNQQGSSVIRGNLLGDPDRRQPALCGTTLSAGAERQDPRAQACGQSPRRIAL